MTEDIMRMTRAQAADIARERSARAKYQGRRYRDNREPSTRGMFGARGLRGRCWCGDVTGHDWPGKDRGKPHPPRTER